MSIFDVVTRKGYDAAVASLVLLLIIDEVRDEEFCSFSSHIWCTCSFLLFPVCLLLAAAALVSAVCHLLHEPSMSST